MNEADKYRAILEKDPNDIQAFVNLCNIVERDGDFEYLAQLYEYRAQVVEDFKEISDLYFKAGELYLDKVEDQTRGVESLLLGFEQDRTHGGIGDRLDTVYREAGDWEAALYILEQRLEAVEKSDINGTKVVIRSDLHQQVGEIYERAMEDPKHALSHYRKAIELDKSNIMALYSAREIYYNAGKYKNAATLCEIEAKIEKDTERRIALYRELAHILSEHLNENGQAAKALKRALKLSPNDVEIRLDFAKTIASVPFEDKNIKDHKWAFDYLLHNAKRSDPVEAVRLSRLALMALPKNNEKAVALIESRAADVDDPEVLVAAYEQIIASKPDLKAQAPTVRKLAQLFANIIGDPQKALEQLNRLASLKNPEDLELIEELKNAPLAEPLRKAPAAYDDDELETSTGYSSMPANIAIDDLASSPAEAIAPSGAPRRHFDSELPPPPADPAEIEKYVAQIHSFAERARRAGDDAAAEQRMMQVLEYAPYDQKASTYLERRFRSRGDWTSLRDLLMRSAEAEHIPPAVKTVRLREAARLSEEQLSDADGAIAVWKLILKNDPKVRDAADALKRLLEQAERWVELLDTIKQEAENLKSRSKRIDAYRRVAEISSTQLDDVQSATDAYQHILELSPDDGAAMVSLEALYEQEGQFEALVPLLKRRAEITRGRAEKKAILLKTATVLKERLNRPEDAYALAKEILALAPGDGQVFDIMEAIDEDQQEWPRLVEVLSTRAKISKDPDDKGRHLRKIALTYSVQLEDAKGAIDAWRKVLEVLPDDSQALDTLTKLYTENEQWSQLIEIHNKRIAVLSDDRDKADVHRQIALILEQKMDDADAAMQSWRKVLEIDEDSESLGALSRYYERNENWTELAEVLRRQAPYAEDTTERAEVLFSLASLLDDKLDQSDEALEILERIHKEVEPTHPATIRLLSDILVKTEKYDRATQLLEEQINYTQDDEERKQIWVQVGNWSRHHLNDLERSREAFEQAVRLAPEDGEILDSLQEVYIGLPDAEQLVKLLFRRFQLAGDDQEKLDFIIQGADVCEKEIEDNARAWSWYRQAFDSLNHMENVLPLVEQAAERLGTWKELIDVYAALTRSSEEIKDQVANWLKIADVFEQKLEDPDQALEAGLRAYGLIPDDRDLLSRIDTLAVNAKNWGRLATVYSVLTKRTEEKQDKIELLVRYAKLLNEQADKGSEAFDISVKALELDPGSETLFKLVEELGASANRWRDLVGVYNGYARLKETTEEKVQFKLQAADVFRNKLDEPENALSSALEALDVDPMDENVREQIWTLIRALEDDATEETKGSYWSGLIGAFNGYVRELRNDRERQAQLLLIVAKIHERELNDFSAAFDCLKSALALLPQDDSLLDKLETMTSEHSLWEDLAEHYGHVLDETFELSTAIFLHRRRARILAEKLDRPDEAADHYWQIIQLDASDKNAYSMLLTHYEDTEQWNELVNLLERQLDNSQDKNEKVELLLQIAGIWKNNIKNRYEAKDWFEQIMLVDPDNEKARAELDDLAAADEANGEEEDKDDDIMSLISIPPPDPIEDEPEQEDDADSPELTDDDELSTESSESQTAEDEAADGEVKEDGVAQDQVAEDEVTEEAADESAATVDDSAADESDDDESDGTEDSAAESNEGGSEGESSAELGAILDEPDEDDIPLLDADITINEELPEEKDKDDSDAEDDGEEVSADDLIVEEEELE